MSPRWFLICSPRLFRRRITTKTRSRSLGVRGSRARACSAAAWCRARSGRAAHRPVLRAMTMSLPSTGSAGMPAALRTNLRIRHDRRCRSMERRGNKEAAD
uniref:Uncharacterized protein n=1 Tax=Arundo donax TaxID=35708 RepID=A0A0A9UAD5_ARUDO